MTSTQTPDEATADHHHAHPSPRQYVQVALILAVLTAAEVSTYYFDFGVLAIPMLIVLMIVKFGYVASYFMHLKFDNKVFSQLMYGGLILAASLYAVTIVVTLLGQAPTL
jgi:cytochrome c oxidase subunit IV